MARTKKKTKARTSKKRTAVVRKKKTAVRARRQRKVAPKKKAALTGARKVRLEKIGEVTHYFPRVKAAAILVLKDGLRKGDALYVKGHTTDFKQTARSIQLNRIPIEEAHKGEEIGLLVKSRARIGDSVYKI